MPLEIPGEPETGRLILKQAGGVDRDPAGAAEAKVARAVDGPETVAAASMERFVIATAGEPPADAVGSKTGSVGRMSRCEANPAKTVRRSTMTMREALSRGGLPRSTPYDRGRHVQADDNVCVVHLRRAL